MGSCIVPIIVDRALVRPTMALALDLSLHEVVDVRWIPREQQGEHEPAVLEVTTIGGVRNRIALFRVRPQPDKIATEDGEV